jgi:6-phosphogluconolactonase (cycloisomerase 2 family)
MKFWNFGKTLLMAALSAGVIFGFTSCTQSFSVGFLYITGVSTANPGSTNGIISGYKIDNNTGKLTSIHGLPVGSGGANPSRAVMVSGGRFLYVLNMGVNKAGTPCDSVTTAQLNGDAVTTADPADYECSGANITFFTVGGGGVLTQEGTYTTQGVNPFRLIADSSGNYLLALEKSSPLNPDATAACQGVMGNVNFTNCGDVTVFQVNQSTGRLSTIQNAQLTAASSGAQLTYFPVPAEPVGFTLASGYLMTLAAPNEDQYISTVTHMPTPYTTGNVAYPYTYNSTNGQLTQNANSIGTYVLTNGDGNPVQKGTNIVTASSYVYVLDNESIFDKATSTTVLSQILPFTVSGGALTSQIGGAVPNDPTLSNPVNLMIESKNKFLFVINDGQGNSSSDPSSGISQFVLDPASHQLTPNSPSTSGSGSKPQCILEDPTFQYIYTASYDSATVDGRVLDPNIGVLKLLRDSATASSYALPGPATWCVVTGRTN